MIDLMKKAIEVLKVRVADNLTVIRTNELRFRKLMDQQDLNSDELSQIIDSNKTLLAENFDFINIQLSMLKFVEKYQYKEVALNNDNAEEADSEENAIDYFEYTISGKLPYNNMHPMFHDQEFFEKLLKYYEENEMYECCAEILSLKNKA